MSAAPFFPGSQTLPAVRRLIWWRRRAPSPPRVARRRDRVRAEPPPRRSLLSREAPRPIRSLIRAPPHPRTAGDGRKDGPGTGAGPVVGGGSGPNSRGGSGRGASARPAATARRAAASAVSSRRAPAASATRVAATATTATSTAAAATRAPGAPPRRARTAATRANIIIIIIGRRTRTDPLETRQETPRGTGASPGNSIRRAPTDKSHKSEYKPGDAIADIDTLARAIAACGEPATWRGCCRSRSSDRARPRLPRSSRRAAGAAAGTRRSSCTRR